MKETLEELYLLPLLVFLSMCGSHSAHFILVCLPVFHVFGSLFFLCGLYMLDSAGVFLFQSVIVQPVFVSCLHHYL